MRRRITIEINSNTALLVALILFVISYGNHLTRADTFTTEAETLGYGINFPGGEQLNSTIHLSPPNGLGVIRENYYESRSFGCVQGTTQTFGRGIFQDGVELPVYDDIDDVTPSVDGNGVLFLFSDASDIIKTKNPEGLPHLLALRGNVLKESGIVQYTTDSEEVNSSWHVGAEDPEKLCLSYEKEGVSWFIEYSRQFL